MAEVGVAAAAGNFGAGDAEGAVDFLDDIFLGDGLIEAGPAGAGIEFGGGVEESGVAADAAEDSRGRDCWDFRWCKGARCLRGA